MNCPITCAEPRGPRERASHSAVGEHGCLRGVSSWHMQHMLHFSPLVFVLSLLARRVAYNEIQPRVLTTGNCALDKNKIEFQLLVWVYIVVLNYSRKESSLSPLFKSTMETLALHGVHLKQEEIALMSLTFCLFVNASHWYFFSQFRSLIVSTYSSSSPSTSFLLPLPPCFSSPPPYSYFPLFCLPLVMTWCKQYNKFAILKRNVFYQ